MKKKIFILLLCSILFITACGKKENMKEENNKSLSVNLTKLTIESNSLKRYTIDDFNDFLEDYKSNKLPQIYLTEFLFDGVSIVKTYDLDDYIESGNDVNVKNLEVLVLNVNTIGNIELSGEFKGMIAVNSNDITSDINLILNGVNIDTDSKKAPAIYVYNKDTTYSDHKVTIKTAMGSKNYIEGGKLKKVSLLDKDNLNTYKDKYSSKLSNWLNKYTNYYGIYNSNELKNILFASVTADNEDLSEGSPYYFYKASGAISSDIDLYFEGTGYLEVTSKNKEGIESKGNLKFIGGTGDYVITSEDDCINTTTKSSAGNNIHNDLIIDVNSLKAIVSMDADEGDAIDSNGTLIINGGTIYAISHPGADSGLDSEKGTTINGGIITATGDMYDQVNSTSTQNFMVLSFNQKVDENVLIVLLDENDNIVFNYTTDRTYTKLVYSSQTLKEGTYYLYKGGQIDDNTYTKGTLLGYSSSGMIGGMGGNTRDMNEKIDNFNMPINQDGQMPPIGDFKSQRFNGMNSSATNKEFKISGVSNLFNGISEFVE